MLLDFEESIPEPPYRFFEDWYEELEGFHFRSDRCWEELNNQPSEKTIQSWLRAAFNAGKGLT